LQETSAATKNPETGKKKANPASMPSRKAVLEAYACFSNLRIQVSNYTVPVGEVLGEAIARASLIIQELYRDVDVQKKSARKAKQISDAAHA
jgi:hypothetical protein